MAAVAAVVATDPKVMPRGRVRSGSLDLAAGSEVAVGTGVICLKKNHDEITQQL